jgi:hypothetical protein
MHGLNGMKSSVYFSCCTVIKKNMEHMPPLPPLRWRQNAHNTFLPETHEYIHCERSAMADGCHSPPMQKNAL